MFGSPPKSDLFLLKRICVAFACCAFHLIDVQRESNSPLEILSHSCQGAQANGSEFSRNERFGVPGSFAPGVRSFEEVQPSFDPRCWEQLDAPPPPPPPWLFVGGLPIIVFGRVVRNIFFWELPAWFS